MKYIPKYILTKFFLLLFVKAVKIISHSEYIENGFFLLYTKISSNARITIEKSR